MPSAYLQWWFHSGERIVARGPLVINVLSNCLAILALPLLTISGEMTHMAEIFLTFKIFFNVSESEMPSFCAISGTVYLAFLSTISLTFDTVLLQDALAFLNWVQF